jgi:hypothetical protein
MKNIRRRFRDYNVWADICIGLRYSPLPLERVSQCNQYISAFKNMVDEFVSVMILKGNV